MAGLAGRSSPARSHGGCTLDALGVRPESAVVCDPNPDVLAWYEADSTLPATFDYRELLADDSVEAVYCAVRHHLHEEVYVGPTGAETPSG